MRGCVAGTKRGAQADGTRAHMLMARAQARSTQARKHASTQARKLIQIGMRLKSALEAISQNHHRTIDSHPKRSSVAIILQVPGHYHHADLGEWLANLPSNAEPELLFIKRAANPRDRWSGHIALPGGRRDPSDSSDRQTAERETLEEVGVDLQSHFYVGGLDERLLRVSWGRKVAMVLCPHVFVLNSAVELKPEWSEVASAFWHGLEPKSQTFCEVPIKDRLDLGWMGPLAPVVRAQLGSLRFPAVELRPRFQVRREDLGSRFECWGVTLGVLTDLFEMLWPGHLDSCWLPTASALDIRFWIWAFNWRSLRSKRLSLAAAIEDGIRGGNMDLMNRLLEGHFVRFPVAIGAAITTRLLVIGWLVFVVARGAKFR